MVQAWDVAGPMICAGALALGYAAGLGRRAWQERGRRRKLDRYSREYEDRMRELFDWAIGYAHAEIRMLELSHDLPAHFEPAIYHAIRRAHAMANDYKARALSLGIVPPKPSEIIDTGTALPRATGQASGSTSRPPDAPKEGGPARGEEGPKSGRTIAFPFRRKGED
ncbi:MAG: hypothetical protein PVSMB8_00060 [Vulcanimicrobiaceae bacterium]